jgi:hypothetical protein
MTNTRRARRSLDMAKVVKSRKPRWCIEVRELRKFLEGLSPGKSLGYQHEGVFVKLEDGAVFISSEDDDGCDRDSSSHPSAR